MRKIKNITDNMKNKFEIDKFSLGVVLEKLGYTVEPEFKFCEARKFKADWIVSKNDKCVFVEYEGIMSTKSRHTTPTGYTNDCTKYNLAQKLGYKVLRYTVFNIGEVINDLEEVLG